MVPRLSGMVEDVFTRLATESLLPVAVSYEDKWGGCCRDGAGQGMVDVIVENWDCAWFGGKRLMLIRTSCIVGHKSFVQLRCGTRCVTCK